MLKTLGSGASSRSRQRLAWFIALSYPVRVFLGTLVVLMVPQFFVPETMDDSSSRVLLPQSFQLALANAVPSHRGSDRVCVRLTDGRLHAEISCLEDVDTIFTRSMHETIWRAGLLGKKSVRDVLASTSPAAVAALGSFGEEDRPRLHPGLCNRNVSVMTGIQV
ncbi:quinate permease [Colletotrichum sojae]|uniref:Quinate permease n=1 Tax=Colletotrichum sojae TaxID=2175907 RepID=A0A8H6J7N9_9PEZI|nr:quinate permease [Colletotrichum sojae]